MASVHAGMKRKSEEDLPGQSDPKSPRLAGTGGNDQSPNDRVTSAEQDGDHTSTTPVVEEEKRKARARDRETAKEFLKRLVLLVELRRKDIERSHGSKSTFSDRYWAQLRKVCDMFGESDLLVNPCIKPARNAMMSLQDLSEVLKQTRAQQEEYDKSVSKWEAAVTLHTDAVLASRRNGNVQPQDSKTSEDDIASAASALAKAEENLLLSEERDQVMKRSIEHQCNLPLRLAESHLLKTDLLRPLKITVQHEAPNDERNTTKDDEHHVQRGKPSDEPKVDLCPRPMIDIIQEEKREALHKAEQAVWDLDKNREQARKNYGREARSYLNASKERRVTGTKNDFDRGFFMEQQKFTRDQRYSEEELQHAREDAMLVGALDPGDKTSNFSDLPDDGYPDISEHGEDLLSDFKHNEIKAWVDMEADRLSSGDRQALAGEDH